MKVVAAFAAAALAVAVLAGCSTAVAGPAAPPVTVASVQSVQAVTLSTGQRIHNTGFNAADTYGTTPRERCEAAYDLGAAESLLTGRQVVDVKMWRQWSGATPGYAPAELRFAAPGRPGGDDMSQVWNSAEINAGRAEACPNTERAPLSGRDVADTGDTYVDVDSDGGESRWCARRWWC